MILNLLKVHIKVSLKIHNDQWGYIRKKNIIMCIHGIVIISIMSLTVNKTLIKLKSNNIKAHISYVSQISALLKIPVKLQKLLRVGGVKDEKHKY